MVINPIAGVYLPTVRMQKAIEKNNQHVLCIQNYPFFKNESAKSLYQFLPATCSPWQLGAHQNVLFQLQELETISNLMVPCFNFNTAITYVSINPATTQPRTGSFFGFGVSQKNIHRRTNLGTAAFPDVTRHDTEDMTSLTNLAIRKSNHENHQNTWLKTCKHHINCSISQKLELYKEHFSHIQCSNLHWMRRMRAKVTANVK